MNFHPVSYTHLDVYKRQFQQGLGSVVGYALPIKRVIGGWMSGAWFLRDDDMLWLIPGDSPMGLRLPLDSVPWVAEKDFPWLRQQDPSNPKLPELPKEFPHRQRFVGRAETATLPGQGRGQRAQKLGEKIKPLEELPPDENPLRQPAPGQSASWIIRTALCVEPRDGRPVSYTHLDVYKRQFTPTAPEMFRSPIPSARASPTTRSCIISCRA